MESFADLATLLAPEAPVRPAFEARLRLGQRRAAAVFAIGLSFALLTWLGGVQEGWYLPVYCALYAAAAVYIAVPLVQFLRKPWRMRGAAWSVERLSVQVAVLLVTALPLVQIAMRSTVYVAATQTAFLHLLAAASAFYLVHLAAGDAPFRAALLKTFAVAAGVLGAIAILQFFLTPNFIYGVVEITSQVPLGPFVDRDHFCAAIELLLPAALVLAVQPGPDLWRNLLWALNPALAVAAVLLSASRGGAIGVAVELIWFAVWRTRTSHGGSHACRHGSSTPTVRFRAGGLSLRNRPLVLSVTIAVVLMAYSGAVGFEPLLNRLKATQISTDARVDLQRSGVRMGLDRPWFGYGLGTWESVYPRYALFYTGYIYDHAHCEYVEWFAETGFVGIGCLLLLVAAYWLRYAAAHRAHCGRAPMPQDTSMPHVASQVVIPTRADFPLRAAGRPLAVSHRIERIAGPRLWHTTPAPFFAAMLGYSVHAALDFVFHIPALLLLFAAIAAIALPADGSHEPVGTGLR